MNIIIPAAGLGLRFEDAGYDQPKPLVDVLGKPMLARVMDNLRPDASHRFIIISRLDDDDLRPLLSDNDVAVHLVNETQGAVDTILQGRDYLTADPLLLANCDQLCDLDINQFIESAKHVDGSIVTFHSNKSHHSYVTTSDFDSYDIVESIVEKEVISNQAVTGVYYFRHGTDFLHHAEQVIKADIRVKREFYVSSVISRMIEDGLNFVTYDAPTTSLGTPEELQNFEVAVRVGKSVL